MLCNVIVMIAVSHRTCPIDENMRSGRYEWQDTRTTDEVHQLVQNDQGSYPDQITECNDPDHLGRSTDVMQQFVRNLQQVCVKVRCAAFPQ